MSVCRALAYVWQDKQEAMLQARKALIIDVNMELNCWVQCNHASLGALFQACSMLWKVHS